LLIQLSMVEACPSIMNEDQCNLQPKGPDQDH
jgi:hypothetical protein